MTRFSSRRLVVAFLVLTVAWAGHTVLAGDQTPADRYESTAPGDSVVPPRENVTVVTTSPRATADGAIVAFAPDGSVLYYNETHDKYFDVDPVPGTRATVEYVATTGRSACRVLAERCDTLRFERLNLSTGAVRVVHKFFPKGRTDWHDIDRVNRTHLVAADITNNRVVMVNTRSDKVTWTYEFTEDFEPSAGGVYPTDWTHLNDVEVLSDGRVMASPRNMDQVVFIDPDGTLNESWTLGVDDDYEMLYEQHNPDYIPAERGGPAVVVSDSENNRVVEYQRVDGGWERTWRWRDRHISWPRDADRLPSGHTLIVDSNGNRVVEVNETGEVVWSAPVDTPYDVERVGTGDESAGSRSASELGLDSRGSDLGSPGSDLGSRGDEGEAGPVIRTLNAAFHGLLRFSLALLDLLPNTVVNGLLFVLPPQFDRLGLALGLTTFVSLTTAILGWFWLDARGVPGAVRGLVTELFERDR